MNRKGQTWCVNTLGVVVTVLRSHKPTASRRFWLHEVVFLDNEQSPHLVGTKQELQEAVSTTGKGAFESNPAFKKIS